METLNKNGNRIKEIKKAREDYLPHSLEDEKYLIGKMFYLVDQAEDIINQVEEDEIFNKLNRRVFRVCKNLTELGIPITAISIREELIREEQLLITDLPFDFPTTGEITVLYQNLDLLQEPESGIPGAIKRIKQDALYREIIYRANDALMMAKCREGSPVDIVSGFDELSHTLQKRSSPVIVWADDAEREAQKKYDEMDSGKILTIPTGYPELDEKLWGGGKGEGDFIIISGVTSGGKTTFCLNMAKNSAELDTPSLYFTTEMQVFKVFSRQHAAVAKIPGYRIRPRMSELYPALNIRQKLYDTGAIMAKLPLGYIDTVRDMETLRKVCKFGVREYGVREVYVDLLGHFKPSKRFRGSPYERMSIVAETAKEIAQELKITLSACVQLRRKDKTEKGGVKGYQEDIDGNLVEPTLDMLKNSGELENSADTVIFLWGEKGREGEEDAIRHIYGKVAKQRNGALFNFELKFAPSIFTFTSIRHLYNLRRQMEEAEF